MYLSLAAEPAYKNYTEYWGDRDSSVLAVNAVANQLQCELNDRSRIDNDRVAGPQVTQLISKWIVQVNLNLTIQEQTQFNPGVSLKTPFAPVKTTFSSGTITTDPTFALGIGVNTLADTVRVTKLTFIYKVSDLAQLPFGTIPHQRLRPKHAPWLLDDTVRSENRGGASRWYLALYSSGRIYSTIGYSAPSHVQN